MIESIDGEIRNLRVESVFAETLVTWDYVGGTSQHRLLLSVDGDLLAVLPSEARSYSLTGLEAVPHTVDVRPIKSEESPLPDLHGTPYGKRAYLQWSSSTASDLASYRVYNGSTLLAEVSEVTVHPLWSALPSTGTGTGRINVQGTYSGDAINQAFTLEVGAQGIRHNLSGSWSAFEEFSKDDSLTLPNDVRVDILDNRTDYDTGDTYAFRIGPATNYLTGILTEGTHTLSVSAVDKAGNESFDLGSTTVTIFYKPEDVTDLVGTWDGDDITLTWNNESDQTEHLIYTNYSSTFGILKDHIITDAPLYTVDADVYSHTFAPAVNGAWQLMVRTRDDDGRISDGVEWVSLDTSGLPTSVALNEPENITATAIAAGKIRVGWQYPVLDGEDITAFNVYIYTDSESPDLATPELVVSTASESVGNVLVFEVDTEDSFEGLQYITIRATDGVLETTNIDNVAVTADSVGPLAPSTLSGVAN